METINVKLYSFNELKEDVKNKVIQDNYDINTNYNWWECTYDTFNECGIKINCFDLYRKQIEISNILDWEEIAQNLKNNFGTDTDLHTDSLNFIKERDNLIKELGNGNDKDGYSVNYDNYDIYDERIIETEIEYKRELENNILNWLNSEYEYLISDEAIIETIYANDFKFLNHGAMWID
jgi:hypothetical protein